MLRESTSTLRLRSERFPRLEEAAERAELRLRTNGAGPRVPFRAANAEHFPPFRSKLRQQILEHILQARLSDGGAGLNLDELVASGRVREVVYVHDDDECTDVKKRLVYGVAGIFALLFAIVQSGKVGPLSARVRGLFVPHTRTGNPLVDSVAEHQATQGDVYFKFFHFNIFTSVVTLL